MQTLIMQKLMEDLGVTFLYLKNLQWIHPHAHRERERESCFYLDKVQLRSATLDEEPKNNNEVFLCLACEASSCGSCGVVNRHYSNVA